MKWRFVLFLLPAFLFIGNPVWAAYTSQLQFDGQLNQIQFVNYEVVLRAGSGAGVNDVTIGGTTYSVINPFAGTTTGDIVIQILEATSVTNSAGNVIPPVLGGTLKAYFAATANTNGTPFDFSDDYFDPIASATADPFGIVGDGATMARWFLDDDSSFGFAEYQAGDASQGAALTRFVTDVTNGDLFFQFGIGAATDGSGYTGGGVVVDDPSATSFEVVGALNVLTSPTWAFFIDANEIGDPPADVNSSIEFTQTVTKNGVGASNYSATPDTTGILSPWYLKSTDPLHFKATPEPGSLVALAGMAGMGLLAMRRRRK